MNQIRWDCSIEIDIRKRDELHTRFVKLARTIQSGSENARKVLDKPGEPEVRNKVVRDSQSSNKSTHPESRDQGVLIGSQLRQNLDCRQLRKGGNDQFLPHVPLLLATRPTTKLLLYAGYLVPGIASGNPRSRTLSLLPDPSSTILLVIGAGGKKFHRDNRQ